MVKQISKYKILDYNFITDLIYNKIVVVIIYYLIILLL